MVLWEITLGTAYFLGLKRTYRLALRIQRRLISSKYAKIRHFVHRRTRVVFDVALRVHQKIQHRDIEVGRNLGNWILRWLDRMKPSAQIRARPPVKPPISGTANTITTKQVTNYSSHQKTPGFFRRSGRSMDGESNRHLFVSSANAWPKPFPTLAMMMLPTRPAANSFQYRHLWFSGPEVLRSNNARNGFEGVIRKDIMQWMLRN
ncbi:uncharacterized protein LOC131164882 [Malania oleifera]|uniref:uncharacterized protein LOC131164882 n=1 Tax=Malania oleifera TaxID=397392 RepID=UPI0025ADDD80|nr:uncharacterized protein LOC131164882 [Malania oleifera]